MTTTTKAHSGRETVERLPNLSAMLAPRGLFNIAELLGKQPRPRGPRLAIARMMGEIASLLISRLAVPVLYFMANKAHAKRRPLAAQAT